jgi:hypothetical protein
MFEIIVSDRSLESSQEIPSGRVGQGIAEMVSGKGRKAEEEGEEHGDEEQAPTKRISPQRTRMRDHGLDFGGFKTMLAGC